MSVAPSCWQIANGACKTAGLALFNFSNEFERNLHWPLPQHILPRLIDTDTFEIIMYNVMSGSVSGGARRRQMKDHEEQNQRSKKADTPRQVLSVQMFVV